MNRNGAQHLRHCFYQTPSEAVSDGKMHCREYGTVFGHENPTSMELPSRPSLLLRNEIGRESGYKPVRAKRLCACNGNIDTVSGMCGNLEMPRVTEGDARQVHKDLPKHGMPKPNSYAIYRVARLPFDLLLPHAKPRFTSAVSNPDARRQTRRATYTGKTEGEMMLRFYNGISCMPDPAPGIPKLALYANRSKECEA